MLHCIVVCIVLLCGFSSVVVINCRLSVSCPHALVQLLSGEIQDVVDAVIVTKCWSLSRGIGEISSGFEQKDKANREM